jgi:hypothetical protein
MAATDDITERLRAATIASHPLLCRLNEIGNIRSFDGGRTIIEELQFPVLVEPTQFPPFTWYSGYESVRDGYKPANNLHKTCSNETEVQVFTASEYPILQAACAFYEKGTNDNPEIDPVEENIKSTAKMISHSISIGGRRNSVNSLPDLVSATPTIGLVGGIDRQRHKFWRNLSVAYRDGMSLPEVMGLMVDRLSIIEHVNAKKLHRPDLILMGKEDFDIFKSSMPKDVLKAKYSDWGFESIDLGETAVVLDPNIDISIENYSIVGPRIYFLHTKYFNWRIYKNRNWVKLDPDRFYEEANGKPLPDLYAWAGNLTLSCSYVQGVLHRVS